MIDDMTEKVIERNLPTGETHPLARPDVMSGVTSEMAPKQEMVRLVEYLRDVAGKPRGSKGKDEDLNSHFEEFIVKDSDGIRVATLTELQDKLITAGLDLELLGVQSVGNANQRVEAVVQGVNKENPKSGFERPVLIEGPHMILAPYAVDENGDLHVFRTIQYRTGEAEIDTPRGFADSKALETGEKMYDIEGSADRVTANMRRIVGEESGDALKIKRIVYLGAPRVNGSFVPADKQIGEGRSAVFAVEVDYEAFKKSQKLVTPQELQRRKEQEEHEGLKDDILDMNLTQYANYKRHSSLNKDMAADFGTDTVVIDFMEKHITDLTGKVQRQAQILTAEGQANREFKAEDPEGYVEQRLRASKARYPERYEANKAKADNFIAKTRRSLLRKAS